MIPGYNTNGFAHHRLGDALTILSELGYGSVALTLECEQLDPPDPSGVTACVKRIGPLLDSAKLRATIETGSRFILDPRHKHQPTLLSRDPQRRGRRVSFLIAAVEIAAHLCADSVSLWSGTADDDADAAETFDRLTAGLREVLVHADKHGVRLSFEPEPGMFIDTMARYEELHAALDHPLFGLTLDVGHLHCLGDGDVREHARRWREVLWNIHIEDMRRGVHEHLMFGEGDVDLANVFNALRDADYLGPVHVELSRHSHDAVEAARRSYEFLRSYVT